MSDEVAARVAAYLQGEAEEGRLSLIGSSERAWDVMVPSYWKESVSASLVLGERTLRAEAFFMRAPDENAGDAYRLLLERSLNSRQWRFAVTETGDVSLVADVPLAAVTETELDQLMGGLVTLTDETYRPYFRLAYATALAEQVADGGPGLDQPPPWAKEEEPSGGGSEGVAR
jgi:hypothetical protein